MIDWIISVFKKPTLKDRAAALLSPCTCGNTNIHNDVCCMELVCWSCKNAVGYGSEHEVEMYEQRREFGKSEWDVFVEETLPRAKNQKPYLRVVK